MSNDLLKEARMNLEAFSQAEVNAASVDKLSYAFDLLDEVIGQVHDGDTINVAQALQRTYTRSLLKKLSGINRRDEQACLAAGRFVMWRAFPLARAEAEHDPTLANGYHAIRDSWTEWGSLLPPLLGPEATRYARLLGGA